MFVIDIQKIRYRSEVNSILENTQLSFKRGTITGIIGPSGAGKSTFFACMANLQDSSCIADLEWTNMDTSPEVSLMTQQPAYTLNPVRRVGNSLRDVFRYRKDTSIRFEEILDFCSLQNREDLLRRYPHECSVGELQRLVLAMSLFQSPDILLLDEVSAGLDHLTGRSILSTIEKWIKKKNISCLFASHDQRLLFAHSEQQYVISDSKLQPLESSFFQFKPAEVKKQSVNPISKGVDSSIESNYRIKNGIFTYPGISGLHVELSLSVSSNQVVGITGKSGSGKSTLGKLIAQRKRWKSGEEKCSFRRIQYLSQDPVLNFHPHATLRSQLEPVYNRWRSQWDGSFEKVMKQFGVQTEWLGRNIYSISGGQRQRVLIARSLLAKPDLMIMDESFSGLDITLKQRVWEWLEGFRYNWSFSVILITHDIYMIRKICDTIYVLDKGQIIDKIENSKFLERKSLHPVTNSLLHAYTYWT